MLLNSFWLNIRHVTNLTAERKGGETAHRSFSPSIHVCPMQRKCIVFPEMRVVFQIHVAQAPHSGLNSVGKCLLLELDLCVRVVCVRAPVCTQDGPPGVCCTFTCQPHTVPLTGHCGTWSNKSSLGSSAPQIFKETHDGGKSHCTSRLFTLHALT